jgi:hypothetical protein
MRKRIVESSLNRRDFIAASSVAAIASTRALADTPPKQEKLAAAVHPKVRITRREVPKGDNAFWDWKAASEKSVSLFDFAEKYFERDETEMDDQYFDLLDEVYSADEPAKPFPKGEAGKCVRAWIDSCTESLRLVKKGIEKGRYQVPQKQLSDFFDELKTTDDLSMPRNVARMLTVLFRCHLNSGDEARAANTVADLLKLTDMAMHGEGYLVHYLIARSAHGLAMDALQAFALHPKSSKHSIRSLRRSLLAIRPTSAPLATAFRLEATYWLMLDMAELSKSKQLMSLVDALIKRHLLLDFGDPKLAMSSNEQVRRVRQGMLRLFEGHPNPFDAADTVKLFTGVLATMLDDLSSPWLKRKKGLADKWLKEIDPWPQPLWFMNDVSFWLTDVEKEDRKVTDKEVATAREAFRNVQNPIGKLMLLYLKTFESVRRSYHIAQLRSDVALVAIACRLFHDDAKRLPDQLSELVDAKLIKAVPLDPFSGQELRYDAKRRLIWSFGFDEKDNGGDWDIDEEDGQDLVWRLPPTK